MVNFLQVYQVEDNNYIYLNFNLISRIEPTNNTVDCDYIIYMVDGFSIMIQRYYKQNQHSIEDLDNLFQYSREE